MDATSVDAKTQLTVAVRLARQARHHDHCLCCLYRDPDTEGFCSMEEARWTVAVSRLLDRITRG